MPYTARNIQRKDFGMIKGKIVLGLCGVCLVLNSCSSSKNATVGNSTDLNSHSISTTSMNKEASDIRYLKKDLEDGTVSIWYFETSTTQDTISIPEKINGKTVSQIGERLFEGNEEVKTVILPKTIRTINNSAFNFATALEKVEISGPVEILENSSFYGCDSLQELNFPDGLKKIGDHAITACGSLTDLYLPGTVEEIDEDNFALCGEPLKIHVPAGSGTEARLQEIMKNNDDLNIQIVEE